MYVNFTYVNIGKSNALNVVFHRHMLFGSEFVAKFKSEPWGDADKVSSEYLEPGDIHHTTIVSTKDTFSNEGALVSDTIGWDGSDVLIFGRVVYNDSAGKVYCTPYMLTLLPNPNSGEGGNFMYTSDYKETIYPSGTSTMHKIAEICPPGSEI